MKKWVYLLMAAGIIASFVLVENLTAGVNPAVGQRIKDRCNSSSVDSNICNAIFDYVKSLHCGCPSGNACVAYVGKKVNLNVGPKKAQTENLCKVYFSN